MDMNKFANTFEYKLIYVVAIPDEAHKGILKIGETTIDSETRIYVTKDDSDFLNEYAHKRIKQWTGTAGLTYELLHTSLAVDNKGNGFGDTEVHHVLENSGIKRKEIGNGTEWYECDLETAKKAIKAYKEGRLTLYPGEKSVGKTPIFFRPEQKEAIGLTVSHFKHNSNKKAHFLWNAKMRFGKTLSALEVAKEMGFKKTIIVTHRPVVKQGWFEDFDKIFYNSTNYQYGSRSGNNNLSYLKKGLEKYGKSFVYFASIQDLRGSSYVGGKFVKNDEVFNTEWDFVVIDEAHEGTQTNLGDEVLDALINSSEHTKALYLSGTPFNLLSSQSTVQFKEGEVYTWDYISEQKAKLEWVEKHLGDSNPYESLPKMNIYTYDLKEILKNKEYIDIVDDAFSFKEFFRTFKEDDFYNPKFANRKITIGDFVYEKDVIRFLDLLVEMGDHNYPFSTDAYRENFRHTLWMVPGVKEAKALSRLLKEHPVFQSFEIVNVAGDGDEEINSNNALEEVQNAIKRNKKGYTITLSCGRLTTGVTVPEWTACLMLSGSNTTSASSYLQTIFRVQTPASIDGMMKTNCYVFDFAPDRTLKIATEACNLSPKQEATGNNKARLGEFLNFCPIIGYDGSQMTEYNTSNMLTQVKKVYIDKVFRNGFDDDDLYNEAYFNVLTDEEIKKFKNLENIVKTGKTVKEENEIIINSSDMDNEIHEVEEKETKPELTPEEKELKKEKERLQREKTKALRTLRAISRRIPLLIYGADVDINEEISVEEFVNIVDDQSWNEFMPEGVTKDMFKEFIMYFDEDVFVGAGLIIRKKVKAADELPPLERVQAITDIFKTFKNPDRETVLTPWSVVNLHMGECIGGANFYKEDGDAITIDDNTGPRWIDSKINGLTSSVFGQDSHILELNSKSGLYPLYALASIYQSIVDKGYRQDKLELWKEIVEDNIYVVCRTQMARQITMRTLRGFRTDISPNVIVVENMIKRMSEEYKYTVKYNILIQQIINGKTWKKGEKEMKFDAVIGNPPYQNGNNQVYVDFYLLARELGRVVSLIFPTGWQEPKNANNLSKLNREEIKYDNQIVFIDNRKGIFPGISGAENTNFILWIKGYDNKLDNKQIILQDGKNPKETELLIEPKQIQKPIEIEELANIVSSSKNFESIMAITSAAKPYGLRADVIARPDYYSLKPMSPTRQKEDDISIIGIYEYKRVTYYVPADYALPKTSPKKDKYKVFVAKAWGNMDAKAGLGGSYSNIIVARPNEICTETYIEQGSYDNIDQCKKHAKYIMTRFVRALFYENKYTQNTPKESWRAVPIQDFSEPWWNESIDQIEDHLFDKYNVPQNIRDYVKKHIQKRSEANIENF